MPRNFQPKTVFQDEGLVVREQPKKHPFASGMWNDIPVSEVPADGIAHTKGYIPRPFGLEAVPGVVVYTLTTLPPLVGRTGYSFSKASNIITKTVGTDFTANDVGNFIVHDDGKHERITVFTNKDVVWVENSDAHAASTAGWVRGPINATEIHRGQNKVLLHIDTRLFVSDSAILAYTEIPCVSYLGLSNTKSKIIEERDNAIIICSNGIFKVDLSADNLMYYKINSPNPQTLLTAVKKTTTKKYGYKYWYSAGRITGDSDTRNRQTSGSVVEHETGTTQYNDSGIDYADIYNGRPVGAADTTYGVLTGAALPSPGSVISDWTGITNGQFGISIDGTSYNVGADFSDCKTLADVAARIQSALRAFHETITCEYDTDHFVITNPAESGTVSYTSAGSSGTDIGSLMMGCESGTGTVTNPTYTQNITVGTLYCPVDPTDTTIPQRHHTHYPIYRTLDIGENGIDPVSGEGNNEEQAIWLADVPIAKAFVASRTGDTVTATEGTFQAMDVGCKLRFQDGTEVEIATYIGSTQVTTTTSGSISSQAAAIGGDNALSKAIRVMTAKQSGTTVTRTAGTSFSASDVGKIIFWAGGLRSHITVYLTANTVTVAESQTIASTGACMDPKCRKFTDTTPDDDLRPRIQNFSLRSRFWEPLPECDYGLFVPGFLFALVLDAKTMYYGQVTSSKEYLIGSYNPDQYTTFQDKIKAISEFPNKLIIYCSHSRAAAPTNTFQTMNVNDVLQYFKLAGQWVEDHARGLLDRTFLRKLPDGRDWMITGEPAVRIYDGENLTENLADNRVMRIIEKFQATGSVLYDKFNGVSLYGDE
jgi:hypothetical protein